MEELDIDRMVIALGGDDPKIVTNDDIRDVHRVIGECRAKLLALNIGMQLVPEVVIVKFNVRGVVAGWAYHDHIRLNPVLFKKNRDDFLKQTVPHEYIHYVLANKYPKLKIHHGPMWEQYMNYIGLPANRCHNYDTTEVKQKKNLEYYHINCACKTHTISSILYNRISQGKRYSCKNCKSILNPASTKVIR